jgi:hypothetical protein
MKSWCTKPLREQILYYIETQTTSTSTNNDHLFISISAFFETTKSYAFSKLQRYLYISTATPATAARPCPRTLHTRTPWPCLVIYEGDNQIEQQHVSLRFWSHPPACVVHKLDKIREAPEAVLEQHALGVVDPRETHVRYS